MKTRIFSPLRTACRLLLLLGLGALPQPGQGQEAGPRLSIEFQDQTLAEALELLQLRSAYKFTYSSSVLPPVRVRRAFADQSLETILIELLRETGLDYEIRRDRVLIFPNGDQGPGQAAPPPRFTISGFVQDVGTGEELIGGNVFVPELEAGTTTNAYGFYSLTLPPGRHRLRIQYMGYEPKDTMLNLAGNRRIDPKLRASPYQLQPVVVHTGTEEDLVREAETGAQALGIDLINQTPGILGEPDILGSLRLLPGILASGDGNGSISVRGGASDQNLILLDEAPIYYDTHQQGQISIFNTDAVKQVHVYKNHIPASYRGRLSSVVDIRMDEGNRERFGVSGGIGLLTSRVKVEGPLARGRSSFMLAGRRTYFDVLGNLMTKTLTGRGNSGPSNYFGGLNGKINLRLGNKDRFFLSSYLGADVNRIALLDDYRIESGNQTVTLRWNHLFHDRLFSNTSFIFSHYRYSSTLENDITTAAGAISPVLQSRIRDVQVKSDVQYYAAPGSTLKAGFSVIMRSFFNASGPADRPDIPDADVLRRRAFEPGLYVSHQWKPKKRLYLDYGAHLTLFAVLGAEDYLYDYDDSGMRIDSTFFRKGEWIRTYFLPEPRLSMTYAIPGGQRLEFAYNRTYQPLQRMPNASAGAPSNVWLPAGRTLLPQRADHWSLGYYYLPKREHFEMSLSLFYRIMKHQAGLKGDGGANLRDVESLLVFGRIDALGAEVLLRKRSGPLRGWISYTRSEARARFHAIDQRSAFASDVDRPHHFSLAGIWDIGKKTTLTTQWTYFSGKAVTVPRGTYSIDGQALTDFGSRNSYRLTDHHQLDLSLTLYRKNVRDRSASLNISILNVYGRKNAAYVYLQTDRSAKKVRVYQINSIPGPLPSLTYNFRF